MPNIEAAVPGSGWLPGIGGRALVLLPPLAVVGFGWAVIARGHPSPTAEFLAAYGAGGFMTEADPLLRALALSLCRSEAGSFGQAFAAALGMWLAMVAAMMLPCALPAWRSLLDRRDWRAGYGFLLGYGASWLPLGAGAAMLELALGRLWPLGLDAPAAALLLGLAGLGRMLAAPLAPGEVEGRPVPGVRASLRGGFGHGRRSLLRDGLPMLAMTASGAMALPAMGLLAAAMLAARLAPARPFSSRPVCGRAVDPVALALLALGLLALAAG
ncbi:copper chaperone [Ancylobacter terrae]|uniref:copper chaperone n=1 Tax=Ancylobacter sp. sgz301288 TaxID=3342077 RepID=UPI00385FD1DD